MPQIFEPRSNTIARLTIICVLLLVAGGAWGFHKVYWSNYVTRANLPPTQPVQFSHEHHVGGLGIDCRYCHTSVEKSSFAGVPATEICMSCHSQLYTDAPILAPIRDSLTSGQPVRWNRVHDLPDFVYFNHSIHLNKGIGCSSCHGRVDLMPLTWKVNSLYMKWCLDCHREPERFIRDRKEIFDMTWQPPPNQMERGRMLVASYHVRTQQMTQCSLCHR